MLRRFVPAAAASALILLAGAAAARPSATRYPNSVAVIGHSGATGYNSDPKRPFVDANENSWATGTNPAVNSIYRRILARNPRVRGHNSNLARDGTDVTDLIPQAQEAVASKPKPELVLVQTVDNDMRCDGTDAQNYKPYAAKLARALGILTKGAPRARIFIVGVWASARNWAEVVQKMPQARANNTGTGPCDLFDASGKLRQTAIRTQDRIIRAYQRQAAKTCARFARCRYDNGALYRMVIRRADLAPDANHLSIRGHRKMAAVAWAALYPRR